MKKFWRLVRSAAAKDVRRRFRDPMALLLWLGVPLLIGTLITLAMGGRAPQPPTAHVLLADEDGGHLSNLLTRFFSNRAEHNSSGSKPLFATRVANDSRMGKPRRSSSFRAALATQC